MGIIGFTRAAAAVALSTCAGLASAEAAVIYNLGSLAQGSSGVWSIGEGVNAAGQVAGDTTVAGATHAFRYDGVPGSGGVMRDLGSLGGHSHALDINAHGQVVGGSYTTGNLAFRAFRYDGTPGSGGVMRELPTLGGNDGNAIGINAAGQVVGSAQLAGNLVSHAFRYDGTPGSDGVIHDLGTLGGNQSSAAGINASGQIAGSSEFTASSFQHAFRYDGVPGGGGVMRDLGTLGGARSFAKAINSSGQVIGYSELASGTRVRGFRYDGTPGVDGVMRELVSLGGADSIAQDINDGGFVVGRADLAQSAGFRAALWRPDRSVVNLDAWLDAADPQLGAHWLLSHAHGISDNGWITGIGIYNDGPGGLQDGDLTFLLDASALVPEPGGAAILGACAVTTLRRRRPAQ